jgi:ribosomal protein L14
MTEIPDGPIKEAVVPDSIYIVVKELEPDMMTATGSVVPAGIFHSKEAMQRSADEPAGSITGTDNVVIEIPIKIVKGRARVGTPSKRRTKMKGS